MKNNSTSKVAVDLAAKLRHLDMQKVEEILLKVKSESFAAGTCSKHGSITAH